MKLVAEVGSDAGTAPPALKLKAPAIGALPPFGQVFAAR